MANPLLVNCLKDIWTKVATNVISGQIHKLHEQPYSYLHTYRMSGEAAPNDITNKNEGIELFKAGELSAQIVNSAGIDVYIMPLEFDGRVRVDL